MRLVFDRIKAARLSARPQPIQQPLQAVSLRHRRAPQLARPRPFARGVEQALHRRRIERAVDPERFEGLCRARLKAAGAGGLLAIGGAVWTIMQVAGIAAASAG